MAIFDILSQLADGNMWGQGLWVDPSDGGSDPQIANATLPSSTTLLYSAITSAAAPGIDWSQQVTLTWGMNNQAASNTPLNIDFVIGEDFGTGSNYIDFGFNAAAVDAGHIQMQFILQDSAGGLGGARTQANITVTTNVEHIWKLVFCGHLAKVYLDGVFQLDCPTMGMAALVALTTAKVSLLQSATGNVGECTFTRMSVSNDVEQFSNNAQTTLSGSMSNSTSSATVSNGTPLPATTSGQFRLVADSEVMIAQTRSGSNITNILRAQEGTSAATHASGAIVSSPPTAASIKQAIFNQIGIPGGAAPVNTAGLTVGPFLSDVSGLPLPSGAIGEVTSASVAAGSASNLTSSTAANVCNITLTAGTYLVTATVAYKAGSGTTTTFLSQGVGQTSANITACPLGSRSSFDTTATTTTDIEIPVPTSLLQVVGGTTTTLFLVCKANFATSTLKAYGYLNAVRIA